ncbi:MAG: low molecular weight protein-tyrosine-phosphatase [Planctomycetota bacterium]
MAKVLFVCLGNICRSPTGESVLQHLVDEQGLTEEFEIDSAGTAGYHVGSRADGRMREHSARRGYDLLSRARKLTRGDLELFDLVIAMDRENYQNICSIHSEPTATVKMLSEFLGGEWPHDVPDPYYGGADGFEYVLDMIEAACPNIIEFCVQRSD